MPQQIQYANCNFLCSWSGGKDSYLAAYRTIQKGAQPKVLLNVLNELGDRSRSHGIPREILRAQASCVDIPIEFIEATWESYEANYIARLKELVINYPISHAVFGDIDIESHKTWEEKVSRAADLIPLLPLWQGDRIDLVNQMISVGVKALIVSCQAKYAEEILGKVIDESLLTMFEQLGVDVCGENGEYHTIVIDGPIHEKPLELICGESYQHKDYSFLKLTLKS